MANYQVKYFSVVENIPHQRSYIKKSSFLSAAKKLGNSDEIKYLRLYDHGERVFLYSYED